MMDLNYFILKQTLIGHQFLTVKAVQYIVHQPEQLSEGDGRLKNINIRKIIIIILYNDINIYIIIFI